ncbi:MAG TPA: roadblock/LC7 domain-containing protein [Verrucomicrobiae bacterium]|nr:roadblock/LC7 domain-containing protein [Verrucomicrobiae bacterium]
MLKLFKNLFGSGATDNHTNGNGHVAAAPAAPVYTPSRLATNGQPVSRPVSQPMSRPAAPVAHAPRPAADGNSVQLPLYTILGVLPLELKTRVRETTVADVYITLPLDRVLTQLGSGSVKISFGELRAMAPNAFTAQTNLDETEISLPLNEILPQINPSLLARRQSQRQVEVPEELQGPFGNDCAGVKFGDTRTATTTQGDAPVAPPVAREPKLSPQAPIAPHAPIKMPGAPMARPAQPVQPIQPAQSAQSAPIFQQIKPVQPAKPIQPPAPRPPAAPIPPAKPISMPPAAPAPALDNSPLIPFRSTIAPTPTPRPPAVTPPAAPPVRPAFPATRGAGAAPLPASVPRLPTSPTPGNGRTPVPHTAQAAPPTPEVFISAPLAVLSESWPEVLRGEIEQFNLLEAHLALPVRVVEPALKQGKVAFPWKVLRSWIRPATLPTVSAHDGMVVELPLRVIAPLFIARQKQGGQTQQKLQINESIPNLFFGFPQGDGAAELAAAPAPVAPPSPVIPLAVPAAAEPEANFSPAPKPSGVQDTNFYVWGENGETPAVDESEFKRNPAVPATDFLSRYATPNEVISRAAALDGVAGALVALPDGLMVASKLSPDLNGDTLAAFLPHIFGKVSQCTKELRMGELNNLHFTVGNVPWKIFRVNAIFFAAFGNPGQPLPTAQLAALAGQLDRKK